MTYSTRTLTTRLCAVVCTAALGVATLTACGSDKEDNAAASSTTSAAASASADKTKDKDKDAAAKEKEKADKEAKEKAEKEAKDKASQDGQTPPAGDPAAPGALPQAAPVVVPDSAQAASDADRDQITQLIQPIGNGDAPARDYLVYVLDRTCSQALSPDQVAQARQQAELLNGAGTFNQIGGAAPNIHGINNVRVDGDVAYADVAASQNGQDTSTTMRFQREGGNWTFCNLTQ